MCDGGSVQLRRTQRVGDKPGPFFALVSDRPFVRDLLAPARSAQSCTLRG